MSFMSYFVFYCKFFIYKLLRIDYLGLGREISLLSFTCNYVVSVRRGFFFLLVLGTGCVIFIAALPGSPI